MDRLFFQVELGHCGEYQAHCRPQNVHLGARCGGRVLGEDDPGVLRCCIQVVIVEGWMSFLEVLLLMALHNASVERGSLSYVAC
jgi:hypothetical protein